MAFVKKKEKRRATPQRTSARKEREAVYRSTLWRKLRDLKRREQPLCEVCLARGLTVPAADVHHIVSFTEFSDPAKRDAAAYDYENLMCLCDSCHNAVHHGMLKGCRSKEEIFKSLKV